MNRASPLSTRIASGVLTVLPALSASACTDSRSGAPKARSGGPVRVEGQGATEAAGFMRVRMPTGATEVKGAVHKGFQDTTYLISFTAPTADAEAVMRSDATPSVVRPRGRGCWFPAPYGWRR